jgi:hypothetical protein
MKLNGKFILLLFVNSNFKVYSEFGFKTFRIIILVSVPVTQLQFMVDRKFMEPDPHIIENCLLNIGKITW